MENEEVLHSAIPIFSFFYLNLVFLHLKNGDLQTLSYFVGFVLQLSEKRSH